MEVVAKKYIYVLSYKYSVKYSGKILPFLYKYLVETIH